jgi:hypothetical protein
VDHGGRPTPGSGPDLQAAAYALDPHPVGSETDVPAREPFRKLVGIETLAVVLDDQDDLAVFVPESNRDLRRVPVLRRICEELTSDRDEQAFMRVWSAVTKVAMKAEAPSTGRPPPDRRYSSAQAGLF